MNTGTESSYRRQVFYQLNGHKEFPDNHANFPIVASEESTIEDGAEYLLTGTSYLKFPGAARAVAIATAAFLAEHFGENFYKTLDDPNLMQGNDPYFKTYSDAKDVYDGILRIVPIEGINWQSPRMQITRNLLLEEYMLDSPGLEALPRSQWK